MAIKIIVYLLIVSTIVQLSSGSAIPIWEFLTRNEKMSHLYSTFAKLVSDYCKTNNDLRSNLPVAECKRDLLSYASDKLQAMSDINLDLLDPYQRGANQLIWDTIMRGHPNVRVTTTKRPVQLSQSSSSSSSSILILGNNKLHGGGYTYPKNPLFDDKSSHHDKFSMDMDAAYGNHHHHQQHNNNNNNNQQQHQYHHSQNSDIVYRDPQQNNIETSTNYLSGPLVIRVRPDGTPVEEDKLKPLPRDDDAIQYSGHVVRRYLTSDQLPSSASNSGIIYHQHQHQQQQGQPRRLRRQYRNSSSYRNSRKH